jgi:N-acetylglucosaminyl-diphospho-decaprenol L-rhamnosyltransferase
VGSHGAATAVVTVACGRHDHLREQHRSLADSTLAPALVVVVAIGDPGIARVVEEGPMRDRAVVVDLKHEGGPLPLAAARNLGASTALRSGAEVLVFLDVDCLVSPPLLGRYLDAARGPGGRDLLCGPVAYLPPLAQGTTSYDHSVLQRAKPHPARPAPADHELEPALDMRLFWSLSFAVTARTWRAIGGFDEEYVGYGAEDTDFAERARASGVSMWWVGGALAYHQWHPVSDPPVEHVADIVLNANRFVRRWGWSPMKGWLDAFAEAGLVRLENGAWQLADPARDGPPARGMPEGPYRSAAGPLGARPPALRAPGRGSG